jgi:hypothetical protein
LYEADKKSTQPERHKFPLNALHYNGVDPRYRGQNLTGRPISIQDLPSDVLAAFHPDIKGMRSTSAKGIELARGGNPDDILTGLKVQSFYHNLKDPDDPRWVTLDAHAIRGITGRIDLPVSEYVSVSSRPAHYNHFAEVVRQVAKQRGLTPNQVQAIAWTVWRDQHPRVIRAKITKAETAAAGAEA